ncbi:MAG: aspartate/glutamate racemase family protein [Chloroflexi bacterium]|nr:aspartate/glutamate racemase family protein [Chloroflexota bacterium]
MATEQAAAGGSGGEARPLSTVERAMGSYSAYGWRARIGIIVPPGNTSNEAEFNLMAPEGVSVHAARSPAFHEVERAPEMLACLRTGVANIGGGPRYDVVALGCTTSSMLLPVDELDREMAEIVGGETPTTSAGGAVVRALRALGARRIGVATPYPEVRNVLARRFLEREGFEVLSLEALGIGEEAWQMQGGFLARIPPEVVYRLARQADRAEADALLISCTDLPALSIVPRLEEALGKPVVTSNTAMFWDCMRRAGLNERTDGFGMLLAEH